MVDAEADVGRHMKWLAATPRTVGAQSSSQSEGAPGSKQLRNGHHGTHSCLASPRPSGIDSPQVHNFFSKSNGAVHKDINRDRAMIDCMAKILPKSRWPRTQHPLLQHMSFLRGLPALLVVVEI